jgi:hypothetical protein
MSEEVINLIMGQSILYPIQKSINRLNCLHKDQVKLMVVATFHSDFGCCICEYMEGRPNCKQGIHGVIVGCMEEDSVSIFEHKN